MLFSFSLIAVLIAVFFSVKSKRDSEEINSTINLIKSRGKEVDVFVQEKYKITVKAAILELERMKSAFLKVIIYLSSDVEIDD